MESTLLTHVYASTNFCGILITYCASEIVPMYPMQSNLIEHSRHSPISANVKLIIHGMLFYLDANLIALYFCILIANCHMELIHVFVSVDSIGRVGLVVWETVRLSHTPLGIGQTLLIYQVMHVRVIQSSNGKYKQIDVR